MKLKAHFLTILTTISFIGSAQVPQTVVVEHFTNTRCGICASRNPGLFTNLAANPSVLHIAVHPSSPYSSCLLNQHNKNENDARTNFYGIYGGTPRIVINGSVINGSFTSLTLFDTFKSKTSPLEMKVSHANYGTDSISAQITIKAVSMHNFGNVQLYVPLIEDSLQYNAPNGENLHHNVFRKVFANEIITAPSNGDSLVLNYSLAGNTEWNFDQLKAMAIIQNISTKSTIQAAESSPMETNTNSTKQADLLNISYYPNPTSNGFFIESEKPGVLILYSSNGQQILEQNIEIGKSYISNSGLKGVYNAIFKTSSGKTQSQKIILL